MGKSFHNITTKLFTKTLWFCIIQESKSMFYLLEGPTNEMELSGVGEQVPGLPPYLPLANQNTVPILTANQHSGSQTIAHSSPCPTSDCVSTPANQSSSNIIASASHEQSNVQNIPEITNPRRNLDTEDFQRRTPERTDLSNGGN